MPNWHFNEWTLESDDRGKLERAVGFLVKNGAVDFSIVAPMPECLEGTVSPRDVPTISIEPPPGRKSPTERPATAEEAEAIRATGCNDWYEWQRRNWGVKWGASETLPHGPEMVNERWHFGVEFSTPWGPPTGFMLKYLRRLEAEGLMPGVSFLAQSHPEDYMTTDFEVGAKTGPEGLGEAEAAFRSQVESSEAAIRRITEASQAHRDGRTPR